MNSSRFFFLFFLFSGRRGVQRFRFIIICMHALAMRKKKRGERKKDLEHNIASMFVNAETYIYIYSSLLETTYSTSTVTLLVNIGKSENKNISEY